MKEILTSQFKDLSFKEYIAEADALAQSGFYTPAFLRRWQIVEMISRILMINESACSAAEKTSEKLFQVLKKQNIDISKNNLNTQMQNILISSARDQIESHFKYINVSQVEKAQINFPFIAKPDIGLRGSAVKKIQSVKELQDYHNKANFDYLIQDLIPYENEVGIFYVRFPNEEKGKITGIVAKEYLIVEGDGNSKIVDLIKANPRFELQLNALQREYGNQLNEVLKVGEKRNLVPYGNHARGAKFIDASDKISQQLTAVMNEVCLQIPARFEVCRL